MKDLAFEWDERKNAVNKRKHGVAFEEARTVFYDENALLISDPDHSHQEHRFLLLGYSTQARALVVSHCYRRNEEVIRIISAGKATKNERRQYFERN